MSMLRQLEFRDLTFAYPGADAVFENVTFKMPAARAVWVRSPGGRGKSTFLKLLAGLLSPTSGQYVIDGEIVNEKSFEQFLPYRMKMGYGFDMGGLINNKTLAENLLLPLQYHKIWSAEEVETHVNETIDLFGLHRSRDLRPFAIPGSQRKLACVIRAFIHRPQLVFLDDPLTGLKEDNIVDLMTYIDEAYSHRGLKQVFFTSESSRLAERFKAEELLISTDWFTTRAVA